MRTRFEAVVVGGGVIGCAVAEALRGVLGRTAIIDAAAALGRGASAAAIGGITPQSDEFCLGPLGRVAARSRELYPNWLKGIIAASGVDVPVLETGQIQVALDEKELRRLGEQVVPRWREKGFNVVQLGPSELRVLEPLLTTEILAAYLLPDEVALEPPLLMRALHEVLERDPGVEILVSTEVVSVETTGAGARVSLDNGDSIEAEYVVVAPGHLAHRLLPIPPGVTFPVKGQAMELRYPDHHSYPLRYHCYAKLNVGDRQVSSYLVPRVDGRLVAGVTYERGLADTDPSPAGHDAILHGLHRILPAAAGWPVMRHWAGVRPGIVDGIPLVGAVDEHGRLIAATGHYGLGVTLAPVTAEMVTALVTGDRDAQPVRDALDICRPSRFTGDAADDTA